MQSELFKLNFMLNQAYKLQTMEGSEENMEEMKKLMTKTRKYRLDSSLKAADLFRIYKAFTLYNGSLVRWFKFVVLFWILRKNPLLLS